MKQAADASRCVCGRGLVENIAEDGSDVSQEENEEEEDYKA